MLNIGLALSGGGARGIYHIGVLKALEEHALRPTVVSGTSAGALVATLYAHGLPADELKKIAASTRWFNFLKPGLPSRGLIGMEYMEQVLRQYLPEDRFEALQIPCYVTATNVSCGILRIFNTGEIIRPTLASASVPMLFKPIKIDGELYLDGGIIMNLPAQVLRDRCDFLIGVNLTPVVALADADLNSGLKILTRVLELSIDNVSQSQKQLCHLLIESPEIARISKFDLKEHEQLYQMGYLKATNAIRNSGLLA